MIARPATGYRPSSLRRLARPRASPLRTRVPFVGSGSLARCSSSCAAKSACPLWSKKPLGQGRYMLKAPQEWSFLPAVPGAAGCLPVVHHQRARARMRSAVCSFHWSDCQALGLSADELLSFAALACFRLRRVPPVAGPRVVFSGSTGILARVAPAGCRSTAPAVDGGRRSHGASQSLLLRHLPRAWRHSSSRDGVEVPCSSLLRLGGCFLPAGAFCSGVSLGTGLQAEAMG